MLNKALRFFALAGVTFVSTQVFAQQIPFRHLEGATKDAITFGEIDPKFNASAKQSGEFLRSVLKLRQEDVLKSAKIETDELGFTHETYEQFYKGIRVEYGNYSTHALSGSIRTIHGEFHKIEDLNIVPSLSEETALNFATKFTRASKFMWEDAGEEALLKETTGDKNATFKPKGELVVIQNYAKNNGSYSLAYKFDVYAQEPVSRDYIYVDAHTGEIVHKNAIIKHANSTGTFATRYSGSRTATTDSFNGSYRLRGTTVTGSSIETYNMKKGTNYSAAVDFTDVDNNWTSAEFNNTNKDNAALDAHWGAHQVHAYWKNVHNRNSYDNAGAAIKSYVHYSSAYDNAYWDGLRMTYGDGSGTYFDALTSLDVCAHEIGHAVCEKTSNLAYQRESGALNEGFSDIWGACIEAYAKNGNVANAATWLIGEDIERRSGHAALRSMSNPNAEGQPDTYGGTYWKTPNCGTPTQSNDYCGVHTNSGVLNYWFYLLTVGGSGTNDIGSAFSVTGLGLDKAAKIAFRTEATYLTSSATFATARTGAIQAAKDLYGAGSAEEIAVTNAWYAVGVGAAYGGGGTTPPTTSYCASKGNSVADEWIGTVKLAKGTTTIFSNVSGANAGYGNFTATAYGVAKGSAYTLTVTKAWKATQYNEGVAVWIDYNRDGDFLDAGEAIGSFTASKTNPITATFTVPTTAATGNTRMRVAMKYNGVPTSCETFSYGEVEDYTLNLGGAAARAEENTVAETAKADNPFTYNIYPNPTNDVLNVSFEDVAENANVRIVNLAGIEVYNRNVTSTDRLFKVDVSQFTQGMYIITVTDKTRTSTQKFIKQ